MRKLWVRIPLPAQNNKFKIAIKWKTGQKLKEYLKKDFEWNNHKKYRKHFEEWFSNLTESQLLYFEYYSMGMKSPWIEIRK